MHVQTTIDLLSLAAAGVRFQPGRTLPPPEVLLELRNELDAAMREGKGTDIVRLERAIKNLVVRGVYEGYLEDVGTEKTVVEVVSIERKGKTPDTLTFVILLNKLRLSKPGKPTIFGRQVKMELIEFLKPVRRTRLGEPEGPQVSGPRFWPNTNS